MSNEWLHFAHHPRFGLCISVDDLTAYMQDFVAEMQKRDRPEAAQVVKIIREKVLEAAIRAH